MLSSKHFLISQHNVQTCTCIPNFKLLLTSPPGLDASHACVPTERQALNNTNRSCQYVKKTPHYTYCHSTQYRAYSNLLHDHKLSPPQDHCVGVDLLLTNNLFVFAQKGNYEQCKQTPNCQQPAYRSIFTRLFEIWPMPITVCLIYDTSVNHQLESLTAVSANCGTISCSKTEALLCQKDNATVAKGGVTCIIRLS